MKSMNKVFLMGHLGARPELKTSKKGRHYARLRVATNRGWMNNEEHWQEKTDWHSVFVWGPLAERCCSSLGKGSLVFVEGALSYWKAAEEEITGETRDGYKNAIHATEVKFLSPAKRAENLDNSESAINHNAVAHPA